MRARYMSTGKKIFITICVIVLIAIIIAVAFFVKLSVDLKKHSDYEKEIAEKAKLIRYETFETQEELEEKYPDYYYFDPDNSVLNDFPGSEPIIKIENVYSDDVSLKRNNRYSISYLQKGFPLSEARLGNYEATPGSIIIYRNEGISMDNKEEHYYDSFYAGDILCYVYTIPHTYYPYNVEIRFQLDDGACYGIYFYENEFEHEFEYREFDSEYYIETAMKIINTRRKGGTNIR